MMVEQASTIGVFLHANFPLPGWGLRDMGLTGWKNTIDWAASLGVNACQVVALPQHRQEADGFTLPESRRLYYSGLSTRPAFSEGSIHWRKDPLLATPAARDRMDTVKAALRYARSRNIRPHVSLPFTLGAPTFAAQHPECLGVGSHDFCSEGLVLCTSNAKSVDHLLELWGHVVDEHKDSDAFVLWLKDPGGCECRSCTEGNVLAKLAREFHDMILRKRPGAEVLLAAWGLTTEEIPAFAETMPPSVTVFEPPLIHMMVRPMEEHLQRIRMWKDGGHRVHGWIEVQENPTFALPPCYPRRIARTIAAEQEAGVDGRWGCSVFYQFVFALNHYVFAASSKDPGGDVDKVIQEFAERAFGRQAVKPVMEWIEAMEDVWTLLYEKSQRDAGFNPPFHHVFASGLFPERLMNEAPGPKTLADVQACIAAAQRALRAIRRVGSSGGWLGHPGEMNVLSVSTELLLLRASFRETKLCLLEAIRGGDLRGAVSPMGRLLDLAWEMVAVSSCAPNTLLLRDGWTKLGLLPGRLEAVRDLLPELVEFKSFRGIETLSRGVPVNSLTVGQR